MISLAFSRPLPAVSTTVPGMALLVLCALLPAIARAAGPPPAPVVVAVALEQELAPMVWVTGDVISRHEARVPAEVAGRLEWVVDVGDQVKAGGILARIDAGPLRLQREESAAEIEGVEARLDFLQREVKRLRRLAKSNNAAQTLLDQTVSELNAEQARLASARARLHQVEDRIRRSTVRAPFAGVIMARLRHPGEWVDAGMEVVHLLDTGELEVRAMAPLAARPFLAPGMSLRLKSGDDEATGTLRALVPAGNARSHLMDLRLDFQNPGWTVGQVLEVAVPTAAARRVLTVPRDALVLRRSGITVYRLTADGGAERVAVRTGLAQGPYIEVIGELRPGDRVIVRGGERLRPGQKVKVIDEARPADRG